MRPYGMAAKSVITTLVTGVITNSQTPNLYTNLETIYVVRKRGEEDTEIGKKIKLFKYIRKPTFLNYHKTNRYTILNTVLNLIIDNNINIGNIYQVQRLCHSP
jgi:hypothetical protein